MYTKIQLCSHFNISPTQFSRYRAQGIVGKPQIAGNDRYYTVTDLQRIRAIRTLIDLRPTLAGYAQDHPHPDAPPPEQLDFS